MSQICCPRPACHTAVIKKCWQSTEIYVCKPACECVCVCVHVHTVYLSWLMCIPILVYSHEYQQVSITHLKSVLWKHSCALSESTQTGHVNWCSVSHLVCRKPLSLLSVHAAKSIYRGRCVACVELTVISLRLHEATMQKHRCRRDYFGWNFAFKLEVETQTHPLSSAPHKCVWSTPSWYVDWV